MLTQTEQQVIGKWINSLSNEIIIWINYYTIECSAPPGNTSTGTVDNCTCTVFNTTVLYSTTKLSSLYCMYSLYRYSIEYFNNNNNTVL